MSYRERHILPGGLIVQATLAKGGRWSLRYGRPRAWLVAYEDGKRLIGGRPLPYEFKSVEQLRYDFERDVENTQHSR